VRRRDVLRAAQSLDHGPERKRLAQGLANAGERPPIAELRLGEELLHEARLADACLALDHRDRRRASRSLEQRFEFLLSSHHHRRGEPTQPRGVGRGPDLYRQIDLPSNHGRIDARRPFGSARPYDQRMEDDRSLSVVLAADPSPLRAGGKVSWRLTVVNRSAAEALLSFPTAQLAEVTLEREGGERYRWSDGRLFAQVVTEHRLAPGAAWTIVLDHTLDVGPGAYEAVGAVMCTPKPPSVRVEVAVVARS